MCITTEDFCVGLTEIWSRFQSFIYISVLLFSLSEKLVNNVLKDISLFFCSVILEILFIKPFCCSYQKVLFHRESGNASVVLRNVFCSNTLIYTQNRNLFSVKSHLAKSLRITTVYKGVFVVLHNVFARAF
jgi:hypothetical protein